MCNFNSFQLILKVTLFKGLIELLHASLSPSTDFDETSYMTYITCYKV